LSKQSNRMLKTTETVLLDEKRNTADLTLYLRRDLDSCSATDYFMPLSSPHIETRHEHISLLEDINKWLFPRYEQFSRAGRGLKIVTYPDAAVKTI
jgi:hypothetical protein